MPHIVIPEDVIDPVIAEHKIAIISEESDTEKTDELKIIFEEHDILETDIIVITFLLIISSGLGKRF